MVIHLPSFFAELEAVEQKGIDGSGPRVRLESSAFGV